MICALVDGINAKTGARCTGRNGDRGNATGRARVAQVNHNIGLTRSAQAHGISRRVAFGNNGAAPNADRHRADGIHNAGRRAGAAGVDLLEVAAAGRGDGGLQVARIFVYVFAIGACHHQRAAGLAIGNGDRAFVGHYRRHAVRSRRQRGGEGIGGSCAFQHAGAGAQINRHRGEGVGDSGHCRRTVDYQVLEVAAGCAADARAHGGRIEVDVFVGRDRMHHRAAARASRDRDGLAVAQRDRDRVTRIGCIAQRGRVGDARCGFRDARRCTQAHRGVLDGVGNRCHRWRTVDHQVLEVAAGCAADARAHGGRIEVDVFVGRDRMHHRAAARASRDRDGLAVAQRDRDRVTRIGCIAQRGRVGDAGACFRDARRCAQTQRGVLDGVGDSGHCWRTVDHQILEVAARGAADGCAHGGQIEVDVFVGRDRMHHSAAGSTGRNRDGLAVAQRDCDRVTRIGCIAQRGRVGDAGACFRDARRCAQAQRGVLDGVVDNRDDIGVIDGDIGKPAA